MTTQIEQRIHGQSHLSRAEQLAYYEDQGYLVFPALLSATELATLRTALAVSVIGIVIIGVYPQPIISVAQDLIKTWLH